MAHAAWARTTKGGTMSIASINPATGQLLERFEAMGERAVDERIARADQAFQHHRRTSLAYRAARISRLADLLDEQADELGHLMTVEMGKPIGAAVAEARKCALACRYYAEHAEAHLADREVRTDAEQSFVRYLPLGPVLAIMPWNFPFWQVIRFAAPALMAGNVGLLKHASNVPRCALRLEELFREAGFPEGCFQTLLIGSDQVARVLDDPRVRAATLTGSTGAGSAVASRAGLRVKKTVLELGGSDPFIVMPTADLDATIEAAIQARVINNGQSCIAAKRFIIHDDIYDTFVDRFVAGMEALRIGDPMDPTTDLGPLATREILDGVQSQVDETIALGGRLLTGGQPLEGPGFYYPPTVLAEIPAGSPAADDEIFGPVASLFRVHDLDEAIEVANASPFGLGSSAWTKDPAEQERCANEIEAGLTFINAIVASDPRLPFGGVKGSGYGRELAEDGIREFTNTKTVYIRASAVAGTGPRGTATE
jgi:succinate-semialdehyde dehydrogenase/glutarate-semialdehyde dehydrogenase